MRRKKELMHFSHKIRHLFVVMVMIAALLGHVAGSARAADDATPIVESVNATEATPPAPDEPEDVAGTQTPTATPAPSPTGEATAPADDAVAQPTIAADERSGNTVDPEPTVEDPAAKGPAPQDATAEAPAASDEETPAPAGTKDGGRSQSLSATSNLFDPVAVDDFFSTAPNTPFSVAAPGVLANDFDSDGNTLTVGDLGTSTNGTVSLSGNGSFVFTPNAGFAGNASFTYKATDGTNLSDPATVTIKVGANQPPVALDDHFGTTPNTTLTVFAQSILVNDSDPDGDELTALNNSSPAHGDLFFNGGFNYTPDPGFIGEDSFIYVVSDGFALSDPATITIVVSNLPIAADDSYTTVKDTNLTVDAPGVLANDSDPDGDPLRAGHVVRDPANGVVTIFGNGSFTYTPNSGFVGTDSFDYTVDAFPSPQESEPATVTITVTAEPNTAPVAGDDSFTVEKETILTVNAPGLLANDSDPNGDALVVAGVAGSLPANGTIEANTLNADGSFRYLPRPGFVGTDTFNYTVSDGFLTDVGTVTITVTDPAANTAPVANDDSFTTLQDTTLTVDAPGVLANDTDPEGDVIHVSDQGSSTNGIVSLNSNGSFVFTPTPGFTGTSSFTYQVADANLTGNVATVTIDVTAAIRPPVAVNDSYSTPQETTLIVDGAHGLLANDSDPDGDPLTVVIITSPEHGATIFGSNGAITYTPDAGFVGTDSFTYRATDGKDQSNLATVTIEVTAATAEANQPPTGQTDRYKVAWDTPLTVNAAKGVLANDTDPDADKLTAQLETAPSHGTLTLNPDGSFTYTPNKSFRGKDKFTYRPFDGTASGNVVSVQLSVNKAASQSSTSDPSPGADSAPSADDSPSADAQSAPSSSTSPGQRKQLLVTGLPSTGAGPGASSHDATSWFSLAARVLLTAAGAVGFVRRRLGW
jgi:large repetitive protein